MLQVQNPRPRASLGRVLDDLGATLLDVVHGDPERDDEIGGVVIHDPVDAPVLPAHALVLGVDLDGVVADFYDGLRIIAAEWLDVPIETLSRNVSFGLSEWSVDRAPGGYEALHRFAITQRQLFKQLKPIKGAPASLRLLSASNVRIRIITHRLFTKYFHQQAVRQTIESVNDTLKDQLDSNTTAVEPPPQSPSASCNASSPSPRPSGTTGTPASRGTFPPSAVRWTWPSERGRPS